MVLKYFFGQGWVGGWEDYSKNKTNLSLRLVEVEAELGNIDKNSNARKSDNFYLIFKISTVQCVHEVSEYVS